MSPRCPGVEWHWEEAYRDLPGDPDRDRRKDLQLERVATMATAWVETLVTRTAVALIIRIT
jgi:hypothetical protein